MAYTVRELGPRTSSDFETLAEQQGSCWCIFYQRPKPIGRGLTGAEQRRINRKDKLAFVRTGRSHAILVYTAKTPVGWCQYGSKEELPRIDSYPRYRRLAPAGNAKRVWRITCFVVDRDYRKHGVASAALKAALDAIRNKGGGLVEAYPIVRWGAYREYLGTVSMFKKHGFKIVAPFGENNVVMRRKI